jgi:hypothetical protein
MTILIFFAIGKPSVKFRPRKQTPNPCEIAAWRTFSTVSDGSGLVLLGLDEISVDRLFAQCLARFEAMQPVYEDEAITITPNQDGRLLSDF